MHVMGDDDANMLYLLSTFGTTLVSCIGVLLRSSSIPGLNHLSFSSMLYSERICEIHCTRYVKFEGIMPSLMDGNVLNLLSSTT